jgi:hypothetical protein
MGWVLKGSLMELILKESFLMGKNKAKGNFYGVMEAIMMESSKIIK